MRDLYLVQRLNRRDSARDGFDGYFQCQYMGSSEFEWGAIPESLKRIRKGKKVALQTITLGERTVYLYGAQDARHAVAQMLPAWVEAGCPGKEDSYFLPNLSGQPGRWEQVDAWWALREDVLFTLDPDVAQAFAKAVKG